MPTTSKYYPPVSELLKPEDIPDILGFIKDGIQGLFTNLYYKNLQYSKSQKGDQTFYSLEIVSRKKISLEIPGTQIYIVLNPDQHDFEISSFPISVYWEWKILSYLEEFDFDSFSYSIEDIFQTLLNVLNISEKQFIDISLSTIVDNDNPNISILEKLVDDINDLYDVNIPIPGIPQYIDNSDDELLDPDDTTTIYQEFTTETEELITSLNQFNINPYQAILALYVSTGDLEYKKEKLNLFFATIIPQDADTFLRELIVPKARATLTLSAGIEFPRNMLVPVYPEGTIIGGEDVSYSPIPEPAKALFTFAEAFFYADTTQGIGYNMDLAIDTVTPVQIGNTGLILNIHNLKIDLSDKTNFPEANADGRPPEFMGVYTEQADIVLPKKWFKNIAGQGQTLKISGKHLLIGTGGISGTIALEAENPDNPPGENDYFEVWLGKNEERAWKVGFNKFDIRFSQGAVVESNIKAMLTIPKFKRPDGQPGPLQVGVEGHIYEDGDFALTASVEGGIQATLFNFVTFNFLSLELGREEDDFFIGTSCEVWFNNATMNKILGDQKIQIPKIRVYTDGTIEFVGGNAFIPTNLSLDLGPIKVAVTGIHFGSQEYNGTLYNYWGFDGAISLNPLGLDARGEGIKYYYPADGESGDSFLRIQTIEADLVIPGSADPESALVIIHGMLSIPEPGESQEYYGEISIDLPQIKVSGGAAMKLQPKPPAFIIDAYVNLPGPIPIGPVGIYGFRGLMGFRYVAEKEAIGMTSGEDTWYDYYVYPPKGIHVTKFTGPDRSKDYDPAFSLGVGATLGTSFDNGMIVSLRAMVLFSFPTAFILDFGLTFISKRLGLIEDDPRNPPFFAFIALGDNSLEFGLGADFQLPDNGSILDLQARIEAGFFFKNQRPWYVNFGTRETPVTATLFKDILNITVTSYLMISAQGIEAGARAQLLLDKKFAGIYVHLSAYIEVGGYVSFKRPQTGGYMYAGGAIKIDVWKIVGFEVSLDTAFSLEAIKPFLLYAALELRVCVRIIVKICIDVKVEMKWEKEKTVDRTPYAIIPFDNSDEFQQDRTLELVKGVHMLTNETFDLQYFSSVPPQSQVTKVIPMDTFIDIKTVKGMDPSPISVSGKIGGHTGGADNFQDLIPPKKIVEGKELRQVTHKYSIEEIEIMAWNGTQWIPYNPYKAVVADVDEPNVENLRFGYWQRTGKQYDHLRVLATTPFSFMSAGQPGWFIPEEYGITGAELFCEEELLEPECSNFLNEELSVRYYIPSDPDATHYIDGAYYVLAGGNALIINDDGTVSNSNQDYFEISSPPNPHGLSQSLSFKNYTKLTVVLPAPSVSVKLKLTTEALGVKIYYYAANTPDNNSSHTEYELIGTAETYTAAQLLNPIEYTAPNEELISRLIIEPRTNNTDEINDLLEQIAILLNSGYENESGEIQLPPYDEQAYQNLLEKLKEVRSKECSANAYNLSSADRALICSEYPDFLNNYWNCIKLPSNFVWDLEPPGQRDLENVDFIINHFECYRGLLTIMQIFLSNLDSSYLFEEDVEEFSSKLGILISVYDEVSPGGISYPDDTELILSAYWDLYNAYFVFIERLRLLKDCQKINPVCSLAEELWLDLTICLAGNSENYLSCYKTFRGKIDNFFKLNNQYAYIQGILKYLTNRMDHTISLVGSFPFLQVGFDLFNNASEIISVLRDIANCDESANNEKGCSTSVQEVCWLTLQRYEYNQTIPGQAAVEQDQEDMQEGLNATVQPIWRPNTKYYIHFKLKDIVDNVDNGQGIFNYYYGFRTVGPIGFYHNNPDSHYIPDGEKPDGYALTSLRSYIDYNRSYPNADSNLLKSKPLFYGNEQCTISLFFMYPYVYHMLNSWKAYQGMPEVVGTINIVIKDPVTGVVVPYPLPEDYDEVTVPIPKGDEDGNLWTSDNDPRLPLEIQTLISYIKNINASGSAIQCKLILGDTIVPQTYVFSVKLTNLRKQKLYTAIVYNAFDLNGNGQIDTQPQQDPKNNERQQVHEFVFQTSRYESFEKQVSSYLLISDEDENLQMQAVYDIILELENDSIERAYDIISGEDEVGGDLEVQYLDYFDRITEGIFAMPPSDPPTHTEFNRIINSLTGEIIAIVIRNPEPFNDPKIPVDEINDMITIIDDAGIAEGSFKVLYNRDYSQALLMHNSKKITDEKLTFRFKYYTWDGYEYTLVSQIDAPDIVINPIN